MGLIREPKNVDFTVESKPWTEEELRDFRKLMTELKAKNAKKKIESNNCKKESACVMWDDTSPIGAVISLLSELPLKTLRFAGDSLRRRRRY